jgi:hypothetical protein
MRAATIVLFTAALLVSTIGLGGSSTPHHALTVAGATAPR